MAKCVVLEDSSVGLQAGAASGATLIAQTGWIRTDTSGLGQFASIESYDGIDAGRAGRFRAPAFWGSRNRPIVSALHSGVSQVFAMFISTI